MAHLIHTVNLQTILYSQQNYKQKQNGRNTVSDTTANEIRSRKRLSVPFTVKVVVSISYLFIFSVLVFSRSRVLLPES